MVLFFFLKPFSLHIYCVAKFIKVVFAELSEKHGAESVSCSWALDCIATFNLQPTVDFPVEDFDSEVL